MVDVEVAVARSPFVGGQSSAVLELLEGRENLPVTAWRPAAVDGLRGRPTILSNAETFAQVATLLALGPAGYAELGTPEDPGTTLLTVAGDSPNGVVLEVPFGAELAQVVEYCGYDPAGAVLLGGYQGTWVPPGHARGLRLSRRGLAARGLTLGRRRRAPPGPAHVPRRRHRRRHRLPGRPERGPLRAVRQRPPGARRRGRSPRRRRRPLHDPPRGRARRAAAGPRGLRAPRRNGPARPLAARGVPRGGRGRTSSGPAPWCAAYTLTSPPRRLTRARGARCPRPARRRSPRRRSSTP